jgi:hypothetical protein
MGGLCDPLVKITAAQILSGQTGWGVSWGAIFGPYGFSIASDENQADEPAPKAKAGQNCSSRVEQQIERPSFLSEQRGGRSANDQFQLRARSNLLFSEEILLANETRPDHAG